MPPNLNSYGGDFGCRLFARFLLSKRQHTLGLDLQRSCSSRVSGGMSSRQQLR